MKTTLQLFVTSILLLALASCSLAVPKQQTVTVNSAPSGAKIYANGSYVGDAPTTLQADRDKTLALLAKKGSQSGTASVGRQLSSTGMMDIVGGLFLALPFIGLLSPGAWELEQNQVTIPLSN